MRSDLKIGMVLGILLVVGVLVVVVYRQQPSEPETVPITVPEDVTPTVTAPAEPVEEEVVVEPERPREPVAPVVEVITPPTPTPTIPEVMPVPTTEPESEDIAEVVAPKPIIEDLTIPAIKPEAPIIPPSAVIPEPPAEEPLPFAPEPELGDAAGTTIELPTSAPEPDLPFAPEPMPTATATQERVHVVQKGDSLYSLAQRYYGNGKYWRVILEANGDVIEDPDALKLGWELTIPPKADVVDN